LASIRRNFGTEKIDKESLKKEALKEATGVIPNAHHSNAEKLINSVGVIKVKGSMAICDGGGGSLGHPIEYIQLELQNQVPSICKYCGLRYVKDDHHH